MSLQSYRLRKGNAFHVEREPLDGLAVSRKEVLRTHDKQLNLAFESERPPQPHPQDSSWRALEPASVHLWTQLPAGSPSSVDPAPRSGESWATQKDHKDT